MILDEKNKRKNMSDIRTRCLCGEMYEQQTQEEIYKNDKNMVDAMRKLRKMKITEIIVKIVAFSWAVIWSMASILCFFADGHKLAMLFTALFAVAFWFILARSAGSVGLLSMEIRELKKELEKRKYYN